MGGVITLVDADGTEHYLATQGVVTEDSGEGWSWEGDTATLTLSGYNGKSLGFGYLANLVLTAGSVNTFETCGLGCAYNCPALTIQGSGELIVTSSLKINQYSGPVVLADRLVMTGGPNQGDSQPLFYDTTLIPSGGNLIPKTSEGIEAIYVRIAPSSPAADSNPAPTPANDKNEIATGNNLPAAPTASTVLVNGEKKAFDAYNIEGSNYFKLRDLAYVLNGTDKQFEVGWDAAANAISLTSGKAYTAAGGEMAAQESPAQAEAVRSSSKILLDGAEVALTAYTINGNNYFKLRDLGQAFDFGVGWDGEAQTISIDTSTGYTAE